MASPLAVRAKIYRVGAGVIALVGMAIAPAYADVGVTSATDGDPLGRPPTLSERVLRVGINIQANEVITTKADDRAHILFLDGTSLTIASNAELVIDRYVYDPNSKTGDIAVSVSKGVLRLVGGKISKNTPMVVKTPSATIGIRGGIAVIAADSTKTEARFLFGTAMTVSANGRTETATRAGSQIITPLGAAPGLPTIIPAGALTNQLAALEGRTAKNDSRPDEAAKTSGFSSNNSGQAVIIGQPAPNMQAINKAAVQAVSNAGVDRQPLVETGATLVFANATPQSVRGAVPPLVLPPQVTPVTGGPAQPIPSPVPQSNVTIPAALVVGALAIQRPVATGPVAGVGNGSQATPSSPSSPASKPATTPTFGGGPGPTSPSTTTRSTGPSTPILTTASKPPTTTTPTTTPTTVSTKNGATPAIGIGNGGLVIAVPPTNSRGGKK